MPGSVRFVLILLVAGVIVGAPWAYKSYRNAHYRNFRVVREGVLYRSGQLSLSGLKRVIHDHGIKTVVSFRYGRVAGQEPPDKAEELFCRKEGYKYFRIPMRDWEDDFGARPPADQSVADFCKVMADPANYPVLIHCYAGVHRTGAFCAIYRMEFEGWSNAQAIAEMKALGYSTLDDELDILGYMEQYRLGQCRTCETSEE